MKHECMKGAEDSHGLVWFGLVGWLTDEWVGGLRILLRLDNIEEMN